jgi:hypothetical protein
MTDAAHAQESAEVEAILKRGIQLRREGQDEAALAVFQEAEAQAPSSVRVLLHVATAAQAASKWLLADEYLKKADSHSSDPYYVRYRAEIEEVRSTTAQRVGHFRAVGEPSGAEVILNGQVIGTLPMENSKTVEAGTYVLEVNKPGFFRLRRPISVPGGVLTRETVELNERTGADAEAAGPGGVAAEPVSFWASSGMTWTLAGVAAAAGVTSGVSFFLRERAAEHWNDEERCLSQAAGEAESTRADLCSNVRNDIDTAEQVGIITGVVGVAFAGAALTHWIATSGGGDDDPAVDSARRDSKSTGSVQCSPGLLSVVCSGSF